MGFGLGVSKFAEDTYLVNSPFVSLVGCGDVCCCMCFDSVFHMFAAGWWFGLVGQLGGVWLFKVCGGFWFVVSPLSVVWLVVGFPVLYVLSWLSIRVCGLCCGCDGWFGGWWVVWWWLVKMCGLILVWVSSFECCLVGGLISCVVCVLMVFPQGVCVCVCLRCAFGLWVSLLSVAILCEVFMSHQHHCHN